MIVKELDIDDRPREKAEKFGVQALTNAECLAIILRAGVPGHPITEIARDLMRRNENKFLLLERMDDEELRQTPGIGRVKVLELRTILEVMRRYARESIGDRPRIRTSGDIYNLMMMDMRNLAHEEMWAIFVDNSNSMIHKMRVSEGGATATVHDNKKVLRQAILRGAQGVILCHNHPSGTLLPSGPDQHITDSFASACKTLDLRFLDHIIISTEGYFSFRDEGRL